MPLDDFWHGSSELIWAYRESHDRKHKEQLEKINFEAWVQGLYNLRALYSVHSHMNLSEQDQHKAVEYFEHPIDLFDNVAPKTKELRRQEAIAKRKEEEERKIKLMVANTQLALQRKKRKVVR